MVSYKNKSILTLFPCPLRLNVLFIFVTVLWGSFFFSCNRPSGTAPVHSDYNKILDSAIHTYDHRKPQKAISYLDSLTPRYKELETLQKFGYYDLNCNYFFHVKKDNNKSMLYADSMMNLFDTPDKKLKYLSQYGFSYFAKGDVLFAENKYNEAYQYFYQGKLIAKKDVNDCTLSDYSYRMGMIMYKQEHFGLAAANFKSSSNETATCDLTFKSFYRRQELFDNTGLCYTKINQDDSAMVYFKKALDFINMKSERFKEQKDFLDAARGVVYGNEANLYIKNGNYRIAKQLLKMSSTINLLKGHDNRDAELSELKLAHIYYQAGETDSLFNLLVTIRKQLDSVKNQEADADWNLMMSNYLAKKTDHKTALAYFIKYDALKDSIANRDKGLKEADITQQIRRLEKDNEFDTLKKNSQQKDFYLKIASVFGMMLLIIFLLILVNWRKSKRNIKTLASLNHQINDQNYTLEHALDEVKLSSQEKDRILRTVAHDLRNPIGGIAALTNVMADEDYTDEQKEFINLIKETSKNSLELINELLEVTNSTSAVLNKEIVEINSLLSHSVELLRFKAKEKGQVIKLELLDKAVELFISREKIWRVISNLISNAIKFSPNAAVIDVKITNGDNEIEITVKDPGIGIPENLKTKVFNMFTEAKRPGTAGEKSFGLGLSISRQIVENHDGKLWFESDTKSGTTFYLRLPKRGE